MTNRSPKPLTQAEANARLRSDTEQDFRRGATISAYVWAAAAMLLTALKSVGRAALQILDIGETVSYVFGLIMMPIAIIWLATAIAIGFIAFASAVATPDAAHWDTLSQIINAALRPLTR